MSDKPTPKPQPGGGGGGPDLEHTSAADGMVGTPDAGQVGETPRGWAAFPELSMPEARDIGEEHP